MRERIKTSVSEGGSSKHTRSRSESDAVLQDLIQLARQHGEVYPTMLEILKHYAAILEKDVSMYVLPAFVVSLSLIQWIPSQLKADLFTILDRFVEQAARLESLWVALSESLVHHGTD